MPAVNPGIVSKPAAVMNPDQLASLAAGGGGAGVTLGGKRQGFGDAGAPPIKPQSARPMMGIAGAEATGLATADAGAATVFPSQFVFPISKYTNAAFGLGMT